MGEKGSRKNFFKDLKLRSLNKKKWKQEEKKQKKLYTQKITEKSKLSFFIVVQSIFGLFSYLFKPLSKPNRVQAKIDVIRIKVENSKSLNEVKSYKNEFKEFKSTNYVKNNKNKEVIKKVLELERTFIIKEEKLENEIIQGKKLIKVPTIKKKRGYNKLTSNNFILEKPYIIIYDKKVGIEEKMLSKEDIELENKINKLFTKIDYSNPEYKKEDLTFFTPNQLIANSLHLLREHWPMVQPTMLTTYRLLRKPSIPTWSGNVLVKWNLV